MSSSSQIFQSVSSDLHQGIIISTDEDPSLRIESFAIINLRGVSTKLYFNLIFTTQTYKELTSNLLTMRYNLLTKLLNNAHAAACEFSARVAESWQAGLSTSRVRTACPALFGTAY